MNTIELYIEGQLVDLDTTVSLPITLQIDDILEPGSIKNTFSKTVSIPNTPANNTLFGHIWNVNKVVKVNSNTNIGIDFNPSKKASFRLMLNGALFQAGYVKLSNIPFININSWRYEINLFGELGSLMNAIGEDTLRDTLDGTSYYNQYIKLDRNTCFNLYTAIKSGKKSRHIDSLATTYAGSNTIAMDLNNTIYYSDKFIDIIDSENGNYNISNKIEYDEPYNTDTVKVQSSLGNDYTETYVRNKLSYKQRFGVYTDMILRNFPSIYGYTIDWGTTQNQSNPYWYNLLMTANQPTSKKGLDLGSAVINASGTCNVPKSFSAATSLSNPITFASNTTDLTISTDTLTVPDTIGSAYFNGGFSGLALTSTFRLTNLPLFIQTKYYRSYDIGGIDVTFNMYAPSVATFTLIQTLKLVSNAVAVSTDAINVVEWRGVQLGSGLGLANPNPYAYIEVWDRKESDWINIDTYINRYYTDTKRFLKYPTYKLEYSISKIYNNNNDFIVSNDETVYDYNVIGIESSMTYKLGINQLAEAKSYMTVSLLDFLPAIKTRDFFLSYVKMFGLYVSVNDRDKTVKVQNRNEFYTGYKILDWSDKVARDRDMNIVPLNFDAAKLRFGYDKKVESQLTKQYKDRYDKYYGDAIVNTGYEFNSEEFDVLAGLVFQPIVSKDLESTIIGAENNLRYKTIPVIAKESSNKLTSYDALGLVFMNKNISQPNGYVNPDFDGIHFNFVDDTDYQLSNNEFIHNKELQRGTGSGASFKFSVVSFDAASTIYVNDAALGSTGFFYKESGDGYPSMKAITHSLNFSKPNETYHNVTDTNFPESSTIYTRYWKKYIEDRYNVNTKIMTAYLYLTPLDIATFKFNNFILIDGALWSVNKISDFDITSTAPTKIEFVKVNELNNYINGQTPY